jgi:hypothetical protein
MVDAMGIDQAAAARERYSHFASVRRKQISKVCAKEDQQQPEERPCKHSFSPVPLVSKADRYHSHDGHEHSEHPMGMFLSGQEMRRDGRQRENHWSRDTVNKA